MAEPDPTTQQPTSTSENPKPDPSDKKSAKKDDPPKKMSADSDEDEKEEKKTILGQSAAAMSGPAATMMSIVDDLMKMAKDLKDLVGVSKLEDKMSEGLSKAWEGIKGKFGKAPDGNTDQPQLNEDSQQEFTSKTKPDETTTTTPAKGDELDQGPAMTK